MRALILYIFKRILRNTLLLPDGFLVVELDTCSTELFISISSLVFLSLGFVFLWRLQHVVI